MMLRPSHTALQHMKPAPGRIFRPLAIAGLILLSSASMASETASDCASETDNPRRLACYDRVFARPAALTVVDAEAAQPATVERRESVMSKFWELDAEDKQEIFRVKTFLPNFLLPMHYTSNINRSPSSPTRSNGEYHADYRQVEAKLQISLRAKMAENLLLPGADLWLAYTQRSLWQIWDSADSSPFRSTDYQPEAIYVVPIPSRLGALPWNWQLRMIQLGLAHQSNGQSNPLSRSWNRVYFGAGLERENFSLLLKSNHRLPEKNLDDNPDLTDFIGKTEISMIWFPGTSTANLTWRPNFKNFDRGSLQLDWTHPVFSSQPAGLRWYAQLFSGYGETLLDYNVRQTSLGLGLTLFHF